MATSSPPRSKNRYTITALLFLSLFLFTVFLFSKRALEPTLFIFRDLFSKPSHFFPSRTNSRLSFSSDATLSIAPPEPAHSPTHPPISPNSQNNSFRSISDELSVEDGKDAVQENESFRTTDGNGGDFSLEGVKECNFYMGTWVKEEGYPIYKPGYCPYVDEAFDCQSNGRGDSDYLKWRWKPDGCDLPRFNATDFLVRIRGKRLMLVGDSMNRNQFESILCLLREGLRNKSRMYEIHGHKITKGRGYFCQEMKKNRVAAS